MRQRNAQAMLLVGMFSIVLLTKLQLHKVYVSYTVPSDVAARGSFYFYTTKFCFVRDCALNSVDSTYGVITFPSRLHSNEFDRVTFDMRDDEYLDINMITPFECFYYSWGIYLMDRWFDYAYQQYGASLNDSLNSYSIARKLDGNNPFRQEIRIFVSRNQLILDELHSLYGSQKNTFYMTWYDFGPDIVPFNHTGDRLSAYFRILMPKNNTLLNDYIKESPVSVFRYKMTVGGPTPSKPVGTWEPRSLQGLNENTYTVTDFREMVSSVSAALKRHTGVSHQITLESLVSRNSIDYDSGWDCLQYRKACYIDNRDTVYIGTGMVKDKDVVGFNLQVNSLVLLMGVNHTCFQNSMYNSIQLYDYTNEQGFYSFHGFDQKYEKSQSYKGSCKTIYESLAGQPYAYADETYYCVLISRNDMEFWRLPREVSAFYKKISETELPTSHTFNTVERSYLQSPQSISAAYKHLLFPVGWVYY